jgi:nicotinate phosphoribosyltransferase
MVQAALRSGAAEVRTVFEVFTRGLPPGRRYGVFCGLGRLVDALLRFRFGPAELAFLEGILDDDTRGWLSEYRFTGDIHAYREGEVYVPGSPLLTVDATFAEAVVLETLILSVLNHDSAVAAAASRIAVAAGDRTLIEMGGRRVHEEAAVAAARAAFVGGVPVTSNLEAGRRYGVPTAGTAAHAFTLVHHSELAAFEAQVDALGPGTTLLVDTLDTVEGIRHAAAAGGPGLGAVRIDSGDLAAETTRARALLDSLGLERTRIVLTGDLDEHAIAALADVPADGYGVGTAVTTGSGAPTAGLIYKLVARADEPGAGAPLRAMEKHSPGKATVGGRKHAWRLLDDYGRAIVEELSLEPEPPAVAHRALQVPVVRGGEAVWSPSLAEVSGHHREARAELPDEALRLDDGPSALDVRYREGKGASS